MSGEKMGRPPSENPKCVKLTIRIDSSEAKILDDYCQHKGISRADGVREAINGLNRKKESGF